MEQGEPQGSAARDHAAELTGAGQAGSSIAGLSIRRPVTVMMVFALLVVIGTIATVKIPLLMMPELELPFLIAYTPYANATPEQIQETITKPLEEIFATIPGVRRMSSISTPGVAQIQVEFGWGTDPNLLGAEIRDKVDQIRNELPEDLRKVYVRNFSSDDIPIMAAAISSGRDLRTSYDLLDAKVKKPLERLPGVAEVDFWGANRHQLDIYFRLDDLKRYAVNVGDLFRRLDESNLNLSLGRVDEAGQRYGAVSHGVITSLDEIAEFPVNDRGLRLSQIADIYFDNPNVNSGRHLNGEFGVGFQIRKSSEANTVETVRLIRSKLEEIRSDPALEGLQLHVYFDAGKLITQSLSGLLQAGVIGAVLAVLTLWLFLRRFRASLVVGLAIPFSIIVALGFLYFTGNTLNVLSMMGLMLSTGMLVDNAVVVLESIYQKLERGVPREQAARLGAGEVTMAVIAATATSVIIFVPLVFGQDSNLSIFLGEAGLAIIFALLCSLFVSLTLIPLAMARFLRLDVGRGSASRFRVSALSQAALARIGSLFVRRSSEAERRSRFEEGWLLRGYLRMVSWPLKRRFLTGFLLVPLAVGGSIYLLMNHVPDNTPDAANLEGLEINYRFSENFHYVKIESDYVIPVEQFLEQNKERFRIENYLSEYGNSTANTEIFFDQDKVDPNEVAELRGEIADGLPVIPGAKITVRDRDESNDRTRISANLFGEDPSRLLAIGEALEDLFAAHDRFREADVLSGTPREEVQIRLDRDLARKYGVSPESVAQLLSIAVRARQLRSFRTDDGEVEMWVRLTSGDLEDLADLKQVIVGSRPDGRLIELGQVADLQIEEISGYIRRENRRTYTDFSAVYLGKQREEGMKAFSKLMNEYEFPQGYGWAYGSDTQRQSEEDQEFIFNLVLAVVMVYFVMAALFESLTHPFAILLSLPFAAVGVAGFLLITGAPFNVMGMIGMLVLVGIVVNNGIVLIDHINNLRRSGYLREAAIMEGCRERLRPIVMTATTTIVGLAPLAFGDTSLGGMRYFPMAQTVMGGLLASTALTLIVLPTYYTLLDDLGRYVKRMWLSADPSKQVRAPAVGD